MSHFSKLLSKTPVCQIEGTLVRAVAALALYPQGEPALPDFLFTSGKQNRFNLSGTNCLYWSESEATALAEYQRQFQGLGLGLKQPVALFYAEVQLHNALDLTDDQTCRILRIGQKDLESSWGSGRPTTLAQQLGEAVSGESGISGIRYRSVAAIKAGVSGSNIVIFKENMRAPDFIRILGPTKRPIQKWP
jgi:RES domain-containing protein